MRQFQKLFLTIFLTVILVCSAVNLLPHYTMTAQAATVKISNKTLTLEKGKAKTLKISGTKKKITWKSSNKNIASVSAKGKVTAKAVGTATITATMSKKTLTCNVTVVKPANPYLKNAPFKAMETSLEGYNFVMPSDWEGILDVLSENSYTITLAPPDASKGSKIVITFLITGKKTPSFTTLQKEVSKRLTEANVIKNFTDLYGDVSFDVEHFVQDKYEATFSTIMKTQYEVFSDVTLEQCIYDFYLNNYFIEIMTYDYEELKLSEVAEYVINSIRID